MFEFVNEYAYPLINDEKITNPVHIPKEVARPRSKRNCTGDCVVSNTTSAVNEKMYTRGMESKKGKLRYFLSNGSTFFHV